ncbi:thioesterase family protein [Candidatus Pelagibacter sp. HIMB1485]|uniref:thioesterase family protein n=1 Tax=Candidatus Pelagibacter sp. HIMB1485 TaxID=3415415 RepID=UPI003F87EADA
MSVFLKSFNIKKNWVDYNNHMNMAYYVLIFDEAWEVALEKFKMGADAAKNLNRSTMVVETNTKYLNEVKEGESVDINLTYFDHDKKRLHLKMEMIAKETRKISASMEWISLYIDLSKRKVTEFEEEKLKLMAAFIKENEAEFSSENLLFSSKLKK